jgi:hypothetical protein
MEQSGNVEMVDHGDAAGALKQTGTAGDLGRLATDP